MARILGFLGPSGTYTEEACMLYDPSAELRPYSTITAVGEAVANGELIEGVVPIENSLEGSVNFTLDLLISQPTLFIQGEVVVPIEHYLMAKPGTDPAQVRVVYSHPQALAQCRIYLDRLFYFGLCNALHSLGRFAIGISGASPERTPASAFLGHLFAALFALRGLFVFALFLTGRIQVPRVAAFWEARTADERPASPVPLDQRLSAIGTRFVDRLDRSFRDKLRQR